MRETNWFLKKGDIKMKALKTLRFIFLLILLIICCGLGMLLIGGMGALAIYAGAWLLCFYIWLDTNFKILAIIFLILIVSFLCYLALIKGS